MLWGAPTEAQPPVQARRARLRYTREPGAENCPGEDALLRAVNARLGYDAFREPFEISIEVSIATSEAGLRGRVEVSDMASQPQGRRQISSPTTDCVELAASLELAISIAIDPLFLTRSAEPPAPTPAPASAPAPATVPEPATAPLPAPAPLTLSPPVFQVKLGVLGSLGAAPTLTGGAFVGARLKWPRFSVEVEGRADLVASFSMQNGTLGTSLLVGSFLPCGHLGSVGLCALVTGGALRSSSSGNLIPEQKTAPHLAAGARVFFEHPVVQHLSVAIHAELSAPLIRANLWIDGRQAWSSPPIAVALGLAARTQF